MNIDSAMVDLENILKQALEVIESTSFFIKSQVDQVSADDIEEKDMNSLVSYVDKEAEKLLVKGLNPLIESCGFITEEDTADQVDQEYTWIIDPLDGTTNFLNRLPHFAISVALRHREEIMVGIVKEVNTNTLWTAIKGRGALMNDQPIEVSTKPFHDVLVATGFPYSNEHDYETYFKILKEWLTRTRGMRRLGSAALDLCYVACGRYGAYYETTLNVWDVAAGALIVKEAGGKVSDFNGGEDYLFGQEILAASPTVFEEVLRTIQSKLIHQNQ